ncbi:MAG: hypothetical protein M3Y24_05825 [Acidobacteriota bacterium]|nr:hypothetical protein [Acidobacteriota bacterium]
MLAVKAAVAQSTLTQIRDTVVNSDGTPFSGTVVITWNGFTGPSGGTVSPLSTSARIYNGALSVLLVPTTTASAGTFYQAVYNSSNGLITWTETWQVPPSTTAVTLSTIRTSTTQGGGTGGSGGATGAPVGQYATLPISINQVSSLSADLASINSAIAALTAQVTALSANSVSSTGSSAAFIDAESPAGTVDGTNTAFNLTQLPSPAGSLSVYRNGLLQSAGVDYTVTGSAVTFLPASVPRTTDVVSAFYRVAGTGPIMTFTDSEIPGGVIDGNNLVFTVAAAPNPAISLKLYKNGVLLTQNTDYAVSGASITFSSLSITPQVNDSLLASYRH